MNSTFMNFIDVPRTPSPTQQAAQSKIDPSRYRTKMCRNLLNDGVCPFQGRCVFAHSAEELRTPEENKQHGLTSEESLKDLQNKMQVSWVQSQRGQGAQSPCCQCLDCAIKRHPEYDCYRHNPYSFTPITFLRSSRSTSPCASSDDSIVAPEALQ